MIGTRYSGRWPRGYASHDEVLREARGALRFREEEVLAIEQGIDDMEAGRTAPIRESDQAALFR